VSCYSNANPAGVLWRMAGPEGREWGRRSGGSVKPELDGQDVFEGHVVASY
jgi:hypothetical protein